MENACKHLGKSEVNAWIENNNPGSFLSAAPESIEIGGVGFLWIGESKTVRNGKNVYINTYQSKIQADNGEWPVFETVVVEKKRKHITTYVFDISTLGTGLK